jgi:hypothetical protein
MGVGLVDASQEYKDRQLNAHLTETPLRSYPKIEARLGKTRCRKATSISLAETGFLEFSHQTSSEMYVDTIK